MFLAATQQIKNTDFYNISAPKDSAGIYSVTVHQPGRQESATDNYYFDQYTGQSNWRFKIRRKKPGAAGKIYF